MKTFLISDTHFNHANIATYCDRPANFTELLIKRWNERVRLGDTVIHLGDVFIGKPEGWSKIHPQLPGTKILIRGNHDDNRSPSWWMDNGFAFACDGLRFRGCWLTHHPAANLPEFTGLNIHGHLHNIWNGFHPNDPKDVEDVCYGTQGKLLNPWQRLFAVEYTNYYPIEFDHFVSHPDKYQARGPSKSS